MIKIKRELEETILTKKENKLDKHTTATLAKVEMSFYDQYSANTFTHWLKKVKMLLGNERADTAVLC